MKISDVPQKARDRRRTLSQARKGIPARTVPKFVDAFKAISSVELILDAFDREKVRVDGVGKVFSALSSAWNGRKSWRT
jgi:hypothetical protein